MLRFALVRTLRALTVLLGVSVLTFVIGHHSGDPVLLIVRGDATAEQKADLRHSLGLDRPLAQQYADYARHALTGDLGRSYRQHVEVTQLLAMRVPASLHLAGAAFVLAIGAGLGIGVLTVARRSAILDHAVSGFAALVQAVPGFWLGLMLVLLFAVNWRVLPVSGSGDLAHLILPMLTLALPTMGRVARLVRGGLLEVLRSDYVRTARAKGLSETEVLFGHALPNALLPLLTFAGLELGDMVGSAFIVETVFAWPGLGRMTVNAVQQRDFPVVEGCVLVIATAFVLINLIVDLLYTAADPRVRSTR
jgi:ABC-type dipeptide/oligopeptide/nickel transport system permease component